MKHRVAGKKLNRDKDHRQSLLKNLATSVLLHGKVETSITKAKFVRPFVEKLITKAKNNTYPSLKDLRTKISNEEALKKLFSEIAPMMVNRPGGYTRIKRLGIIRKGDNSEMASIEIISNTTSEVVTQKEEIKDIVKPKKVSNKKSTKSKVTEPVAQEESKKLNGSVENLDSNSIDNSLEKVEESK
jgi:large subunit ribosomal protein L17